MKASACTLRPYFFSLRSFWGVFVFLLSKNRGSSFFILFLLVCFAFGVLVFVGFVL